MVRFGLIAFAAASLVGPLVRYLTWPASWFREVTSDATAVFVYDLVLYLWPTQPIASFESSIGPVWAGALSVGANVVLFALFGVAAGAAVRLRHGLSLTYGALCCLIVLLALWASGFSLDHLDWGPVVLALLLYSIPLLVIMSAARGALAEDMRSRR